MRSLTIISLTTTTCLIGPCILFFRELYIFRQLLQKFPHVICVRITLVIKEDKQMMFPDQKFIPIISCAMFCLNHDHASDFLPVKRLVPKLAREMASIVVPNKPNLSIIPNRPNISIITYDNFDKQSPAIIFSA